MNINWNKYIDHIFCIHGIDKTRYNDLIRTLEYANLNKFGFCDFIFDFPGNYNNEHNYKKLFINQYLACKYAIEFGFNKILLLEDDIRILNNERKIIDVLENLPNIDDNGIILLDHMIPVQHNDEYQNIKNMYGNQIINLYNIASSDFLLYSTAAVILSKNAMLNIINYFENIIDYKNYDISIEDIFKWAANDKYYVSLQNIFIQHQYDIRTSPQFDITNNYINRNHLNIDDYIN